MSTPVPGWEVAITPATSPSPISMMRAPASRTLAIGLGVAVAIQHAGDEVGDVHVLGAGQVVQVFGERRVERYHAVRQAAADRDLVHVDVRRVQEIAAFGQRDGGDARWGRLWR